jgi:hypothetical protein
MQYQYGYQKNLLINIYIALDFYFICMFRRCLIFKDYQISLTSMAQNPNAILLGIVVVSIAQYLYIVNVYSFIGLIHTRSRKFVTRNEREHI